MVNYKINGPRALISMGGGCSYGCNYCYINEPGFKGFPRRTPEQIIPTLDQLPNEVKLIQCGYDNEFFRNEDDAVKIIEAIVRTDRNVSFSTKKDLSLETIVSLKSIYEEMGDNQYMIACVSLLGFDTVRKLEPHAPDPNKRVETIQRLHEAKIPTLVYLRPLIPTIPDEEIEEVFARTARHCDGYVVGKMIFDERNANLIQLPGVKKKQIGWSNDEREWYEYRDQRAEELAKRHNVFLHRSEAFASVLEGSICEVAKT